MATTKEIIGVDLFAGAGGMSLGFEQAGFSIKAAVEYDPIHCAVHEFNFPSCASICRSVADIDGRYIREHSTIGDADVDVVFGGAPCQGFSMIGKRILDDPRNSLVHHFVRIVTELKPKFFVFENVKGLTVGEHKRFLAEIIEAFEANGFKVEKRYRVLNAADYGVPQDRRRLFLLGARRGVSLPCYPMPTHSIKGMAGGLFGECLDKTPTVWEAIGDIPEAERFDELLDRDWVFARFGSPSPYAKRLREFQPGAKAELLSSSLRTVHTPESMERFAKTGFGDTEPISRFLKLDPDGICNTLRAGTASDRGAFTSPRPIHPVTPRCITVREAARLHSYPDWFRFHVTKWHGFRQIGNSVPPLLAQAVASKLAEQLNSTTMKAQARACGDPALLELKMSEAAEKYGVPTSVIPQRLRKTTSTHA